MQWRIQSDAERIAKWVGRGSSGSVRARICMLLCDVELWPRVSRRRLLATEVAPLKADVYCGGAFELVVAGFSRFEEAPNT